MGYLPALKDAPEREWLAKQWWYLVTVAEAFLGLENHDEATHWLNSANSLAVSDWEKEATATQLTELARLHEARTTPDRDSTLVVVGKAFPYAPILDLGRKFGLALSGGGFRASLYHIGVLAYLADADWLRRVEVISCVSGGSIVGTYFYLELKRELESTADQDMTRERYVEVVRRVQKGFLEGVQRNLRTRVLASLTTSLDVLLSDQTRTKYLGELLESELFARVDDGHSGSRLLTDLVIKPASEPEGFHPRGRNWRRKAKVPVLVLNATTLNTGHLWQFHATWMGEPPGTIDPEVDRRERLRRLYYEDAPEPHNKFRLGHAVAASACVPGLFEPLELDGLYPQRKISLVDGGVFDNQGVEGLRIGDCRVMFVSDASGPLDARPELKGGPFESSVRSNSIGMKVVRDRRHESLHSMKTAGSLRDINWVHLVQDVKGGATVDWIECYDKSETHNALTAVHEEVEKKLSNLRTDLDSFSEVEAFALMTEGYRMAQGALAANGEEPGPETDWSFLDIEPMMKEDPGHQRAHQRLLHLLGAGSASVFKLWRIVPGLRPITGTVGVLALAFLLYAGLTEDRVLSINLRTVTLVVAAVLAAALLLKLAQRFLRTRASLTGVLITAVATVAWIPVRFHLHVLDRAFLKLGTMDRLRAYVRQKEEKEKTGSAAA